MNKRHYLSFFICLPIFKTYACELKVGFSDMPPYSYLNENNEWQGRDVDLIKQLSKSIQCDAKIILVNFAQGLRLLKKGDIDVMSQLSKISSRLDTIYFIGPIREETFTLITTEQITETVSKLEDIKTLPYLWAKRTGSYLGEDFDKLYRTDTEFASKFIEINNNIPRSELILKDRVSGYFEETNYNNFQVTHNIHSVTFKEHPIKLKTGDVYLGFSQKTLTKEKIKAITSRFNALTVQ